MVISRNTGFNFSKKCNAEPDKPRKPKSGIASPPQAPVTQAPPQILPQAAIIAPALENRDTILALIELIPATLDLLCRLMSNVTPIDEETSKKTQKKLLVPFFSFVPAKPSAVVKLKPAAFGQHIF
jgi:hypothetical protein